MIVELDEVEVYHIALNLIDLLVAISGESVIEVWALWCMSEKIASHWEEFTDICIVCDDPVITSGSGLESSAVFIISIQTIDFVVNYPLGMFPSEILGVCASSCGEQGSSERADQWRHSTTMIKVSNLGVHLFASTCDCCYSICLNRSPK